MKRVNAPEIIGSIAAYIITVSIWIGVAYLTKLAIDGMR